ncbi:hypothetical protein CKAN_00756400 [Cinnamomum micranthum f. kanehirae]|uniref:Uncharacterized protein n=1 Tax=Cinnamomum micranthum f. kanehirae TaxID=337451 RepID=A0A3S3MMD1_9MAGN|nr:hypothetical protein CKAN_00756400 [Cinnamomum micranthum f. kanehirae]
MCGLYKCLRWLAIDLNPTSVLVIDVVYQPTPLPMLGYQVKQEMVGHTQTENEGILATLEADFKNAGSRPAQRFMQEILELVQDPKVRVVSAVWDRGLLNSGMAKYIAEEAMKLGQYDAVIWIDFIRHSSSPRKLQMRIAEKLGVQLPSAKGRDAATAATDEEEDDDEQEEEDENVVVRKRRSTKDLC